MRHFLDTMCIALAVALAACATTSTKDPGYEDAMHAVRLNAKSVQGSKYQRTVARDVGDALRDVYRLCFARNPDQRVTDLLVRLDAAGNPVQKIVYPDDKLAACLVEKLDVFPLPPPPTPDYWFLFRVGRPTVPTGIAAGGR